MALEDNTLQVINRSPSNPVRIYIAGPVAEIERALARHAAHVGMCVTVEPLRFVFSGGREDGARIGLINYPRFPASPEELEEKAMSLARMLITDLGQGSASVETPEQTIFVSRRPEDLRA